jgi:UDPglucose--hexose-1-phosphate uridylyltransferase
MLCDYLQAENHSKVRIVAANESYTALVPFWAVWPFEILVIANRHSPDLPTQNQDQRRCFADILKQVTIKYDNLFEVSFPYSMGLHGAPYDNDAHPEWHFHAHFYPPLLRSAVVKKFMVGFEMLGMPQRDLTAETAAERLRNLSDIHYKHRG